MNSYMADAHGARQHGACPRLNELCGARVLIVGRGRMGRALHAALSGVQDALIEAERSPAFTVSEPEGRVDGALHGADADIVLLAVPDDAIAEAARVIAPGRIVGHLSGATDLGPLTPHEAFSMHPLITITGTETRFSGASAAVAGSTDRALSVARELATVLDMATFVVEDRHRAVYHAAASVASNFLVTLEGFAEELAAHAGVPRRALVPLVRAAVENWAEHGAAAALTGPIARGDAHTVARQREAIDELRPERLPLFDALAEATRNLAMVRERAVRGPAVSGDVAMEDAARDAALREDAATHAHDGGEPS